MPTRRFLLASAVPAVLSASALAAPADSFSTFLNDVGAEARRAGIRPATLASAFAGLSPNQKVLERSIDRWLAREKARADGKPAPATAKPWLGSNAALRVDRKILDVADAFFNLQYRREMQTRCWANLPILNEWKRLYPDRDPVKVHQQVWGVELVCPGGGKYVWNENYRTMASTVYGHPGEPKDGPPAPPVLSSFAAGSFGLTFENQGLRARAELSREAEKNKKH